MKKLLYTAVFATLAIASCTKDKTTEISKEKGIDFLVAATRATETTTENLNEIFVTAIGESLTNHFTDATFSKEGNYFVSPSPYYWPSDGSNLSFFAYSPNASTLGASVTINGQSQTISGFSPKAAIKDQIDLIFASATSNKEDGANGVGLLFDHALTQVQINALNPNTGYKILVKGVRIGKVLSSGEFNLSTKEWTLGSVKSNYEITYDTPIELNANAQSLMGTEGNAMLIPQQLVGWDAENDKTNTEGGAYLAFKVNITTADGALVFPKTAGEYEWVASAIDTEWIRGFKYVYDIDFGNGAGNVDPEGTDDPGEEVMGGKISFTHNIYEWTRDSYTNIEM